MTAAIYKNMTTDGYHLYRVEFIYKGEPYSCEFFSTAEITTSTDPLVAWEIAVDAIKSCMASIPNRDNGVYPHSIVLYGEFGNLTIKD